MNKFVGAHVSMSGGVQNAPLNAMKIGAKAFTRRDRPLMRCCLTFCRISGSQYTLMTGMIG